MANKYKGEVELKIDGQACLIVYDWNALAKLKTTHANDVLKNLLGADPAALASILAIGLQKHHPGMTAERILEASPPLVAAVQAIDRALLYAHFGPEAVEAADKDESPAAPAEVDQPKKTRSPKRSNAPS